ncbi:E3 ubiquitin-protein ligase UHRF1-like [Mizuhopecten yessoensis]|uniref:E3 ubiquitin-protein ligase UHRF1 n=1 Tax=Mizuhopecten yessoensis TaxID=6573 RepID=A0A210PQL8_MIZYE|nr:E3 ubiquitin-protein ligase UHRF1-like [Mizuhopecten yessoensis]OWF38768.1 E3 ubiquitin-protein ligase UHRF1 [Mizuhopecten yessoensis]
MATQYEKLRQKNLEDNRRILAEIGLANPFKGLPKVSLKKGVFNRANKRKPVNYSAPPAKKRIVEDLENTGSLRGSRRKSARIQGKEVPTKEELEEELEEWEESENHHRPVAKNRPNFYGAVEDVEIGTVWETRIEACRAGIHRPTVAGIHAGPDGAYSIALSGGYDDNVDLGEGFTYTGEGGRDLKGTKANPKNLRTAAQSKDQELTRGNLALSRNVTSNYPVRVIRGYKLKSPFAPEEGYRYDGMYQVEKAWCCSGLSGFLVWKFAMKRCPGQAPPPWTILNAASPSKESVMSDKSSDVGKSDSGFDSDETGSHFGSQESSNISCQGSEDDQSVKSDVDDHEENETIQPEEKVEVNSEDKETKTEKEEKKNETDITEVKPETEMEEEKSDEAEDHLDDKETNSER